MIKRYKNAGISTHAVDKSLWRCHADHRNEGVPLSEPPQLLSSSPKKLAIYHHRVKRRPHNKKELLPWTRRRKKLPVSYLFAFEKGPKRILLTILMSFLRIMLFLFRRESVTTKDFRGQIMKGHKIECFH